MKISVVVAAHKPYPMPTDPMYLPVQVGKALSARDFGYTGDDTGDNISEKNPYYCELTALYWAWKNLDADYLGLAHYRRHFRGKGRGRKPDRVLTGPEAEALLAKCPVLVARPRKYYIENNYRHYIHAHRAEGADVLIEYLTSEPSEYREACLRYFKKNSGHMFNMCIMRRDLMDRYCTWLFGVLAALEPKIDMTGWSAREQRLWGYLAEFCLDIWLDANNVPYLEVPVLFMERENMLRKCIQAIGRKLKGNYEE